MELQIEPIKVDSQILESDQSPCEPINKASSQVELAYNSTLINILQKAS